MKRYLLITTVGLTALIAAGAALAASSNWGVVKSKSASGQFAVTATSVTIKHPRGMAVRFSGGVSNGTAVVACSRGVTISAYSRSYSSKGLRTLPIRPRHADSCDITAGVGGSGRITVQILTWR